MCTGDTMMSLTVANALSDAKASGNAAQHTQSAAPRSGCTIPVSFFFVRRKNIFLPLGSPSFFSHFFSHHLNTMTLSQLSAAVVVVTVAIAAIGLGTTADDAESGTEATSRVFVVSGAAPLDIFSFLLLFIIPSRKQRKEKKERVFIISSLM